MYYYDSQSLFDRWLEIRPVALRLIAIAGVLALAVLLFAPLSLKYSITNAALTLAGFGLFALVLLPVLRYSIDSLPPDSVRTRFHSAACVARGFYIALAATFVWLGLRAVAAPFIAQAHQDAANLIIGIGPGMSPLTYIGLNLSFILNVMYALAFCPLAMALFAWTQDVSRYPYAPMMTLDDDRCPTCGRPR